MTNQGWLCPKCNSAHAPDVKTCPVRDFGMVTGCVCSAGHEACCMETLCPRRMYFTSKTDNKFATGAAR
jgi:hypothetical protein